MLTQTYPERFVVLFGGQGSPSIFSSYAVTAVEQDLQLASAGRILLSRCHAAFLEEVERMNDESRHLLDIDLVSFTTPHDLLKPAVQYHQHPVLQASTIYLCQILHYVAEVHRHAGTYEEFSNAIQETAGFSSGLIPAAVVARSSTLDDLMRAGIEGFRLAIWIAFRSFLWTLESMNDDYANECRDSDATLSLVIRGVSPELVEERLSKHYSAASPKTNRKLQISAVSTSGDVSVSGPKQELFIFKAEVFPDVATTFAFVHGWYHGGDQLTHIVHQVVEDSKLRGLSFPTCSANAKPIRSTLDGTLFESFKASSKDLLTWLTRHLLVHPVNWHDTSHCIELDARHFLEREKEYCMTILSIGPSSALLFPSLQAPHPRMKLLDSSPFKLNERPDVSTDHEESIAIVGMGIHLPRGRSQEELWETLSRGLNAVNEIPETRFKVSDYNTDNSCNPRTMKAQHGAFLEDPFSFDNTFFNISPREAKSMDPQQRVLLHVAQAALDDAGYVEDSSPSFQRASTGCYIGLATGDYAANLRSDIDVFYSCGTLRAFHSGRISYFYKFSGPSLVTDTACSSSMVSIYQACRALQNGDCTAAIAGGVNVITSPDMYLGLDRGHFLSPTGSCKPFDATADGYCRAEGCVLFVLKRLSDAVAEGDRVHGVIRGVMINQSGNSHSITHPHSQTQSDLLKKLLQKAKVDPSSVGVVEAHGTGTQAGDAREIESLRNVFGSSHSTSNPLILSSIKGNIGHCEAASGAAGLAKSLLMLQKRKIPAQVGLHTINPIFADLKNLGFTIPRDTIQWVHPLQTPRRVVVNNFGAAGSNASLLLEDWVESSTNRHQNGTRSAYVFALSAKSEEALKLSVDEYIASLRKVEPEKLLRDICYTATARRHVYDHHISLICSSVEDLTMRLESQKISESTPPKGFRSIGFVFSGQGALYKGMGQELFDTFPPFRDIIIKCDGIVQNVSSLSIIEFLSDKEKTLGNSSSTEYIITSQCACIALEYALATMLISWSIKPNYVMGHSLGEYAALCVSGVLSLEDTFRVVASRARMMTDLCPAEYSGMVACQISSGDAEVLISMSPSLSELTIACQNGANNCVIGGPIPQLDIFQKECKLRDIKTKMLNVPYAFHTSAMDPILEPLEVLGRSIRFRRPQIPVISNTLGRQFEDGDFSGTYFALHARKPVRFFEGLMGLQSRSMLNDALLLEIGPHPTMISSIRESNLSDSCLSLGTLKKGKDAWTSISETLAVISNRKVSIEWRKVFEGSQAKVISLPGHPLKGPVFLVPFQEFDQSTRVPEPDSQERRGLTKTGLDLLPWLDLSRSTEDELVFETELDILGPLITGHDVGGTPICPASLFYELAMEAAQTLLKPLETQTLVINGMDFVSPLVYVSSSVKRIVTVRVTKCEQHSAASFRFTSIPMEGVTELLHCTGKVSIQKLQDNTLRWMKDQALVKRQNNHFSGSGKNFMSSFRTNILYGTIFARVVKYSPEYQTLVELKVADSKLEGIGSFRLPSTSGQKYLTNPIFTDTLLHAAGFIANIAVPSDEVGICSKIESIEMLYRQINYSSSFTVYCSLLEVEGSILADSIASDNSGNIIAIVRGMEFRRLKLAAFQIALSRNTSLAPSRVVPASPPSQLSAILDTPSMINGSLCGPETTMDNLDHSMRQSLKEIVSEVGGFSGQALDFEKPMDELGIDSLIQIEIVSKLKQKFIGQSALDHRILYNCNTLQDVENALKSSIQASSHQDMPEVIQDVNLTASGQPTPALSDCSTLDEVPRNPSPIHLSTKENAPLCLFHDGSGQVRIYGSLPKYERSTYAFFDPHFGLTYDQRPHCSVQEMAGHYASLLTHMKNVPLIVGGWSFGGIVAYEAAQQLVTNGFKIRGLVLIDSPSPINHEPLPTALIAHVTRPMERLNVSHYSTDLKDEFVFNASLLGTYSPRPFLESQGRGLRTAMLRSTEVLDTQRLCNVRYDWLNRQDSRTTAIAAWKELVGGHVEVFQIPGNHFEPFNKENVDETTRQLWKACEYIENGQERF